LSGAATLRAFARFGAMSTGRKILRERRELGDALADLEALAALPGDSLAGAYLSFIDREGLSPGGVLRAGLVSGLVLTERRYPELCRFVRRVRDSFDVWRVATGYGRDPLGRACLLAFAHAQIGNAGYGALALALGARYAAIAKQAREADPAPGAPIPRGLKPLEILAALREAGRMGREAAWLPAADIEALLPRRLDEVRSVLNLRPPSVYRDLPDSSKAILARPVSTVAPSRPETAGRDVRGGA